MDIDEVTEQTEPAYFCSDIPAMKAGWNGREIQISRSKPLSSVEFIYLSLHKDFLFFKTPHTNSIFVMARRPDESEASLDIGCDQNRGIYI